MVVSILPDIGGNAARFDGDVSWISGDGAEDQVRTRWGNVLEVSKAGVRCQIEEVNDRRREEEVDDCRFVEEVSDRRGVQEVGDSQGRRHGWNDASEGRRHGSKGGASEEPRHGWEADGIAHLGEGLDAAEGSALDTVGEGGRARGAHRRQSNASTIAPLRYPVSGIVRISG